MVSDDLINLLLELVRDAADIVNEVYARPFDVDYKGPKDPVTEADRRVNALICSRLREAQPGAAVVAEESDPESYARFREAERVFFVDPLDGTREFVSKNGEFAVMIGVLDGDRPSASVIHMPVANAAWLGIPGRGAWRVDADGTRTEVRVSDVSDPAKSTIIASRSHRSPELEAALDRIAPAEQRAVGSAGVKGIRVAGGDADAYVAIGRAGKRWDACAADALVTAAGGRYTDASGKLFDYRSESLINADGVISANAGLHAALVEKLRG